MATHEFGLLPEAPVPGRRYDDYEPEKYHCISVDDVWINPLQRNWRTCLSIGTLWTSRGRALPIAALP